MNPPTLDFEKVFRLAEERNECDSLEHNLFELYQLFRKNYETRRLLTTKFIPNSEKVDILTKLPCFMSSTVFSEVIALLVEHKMFNKIYALFEGYAKVVNKKLNRIIVQVFSAVPLPDPLLKDMKDRLEFIVKKDVRLKLFVQPALVGGVMLKFPNGQIYDFSINKMLSNFKYHLMERN